MGKQLLRTWILNNQFFQTNGQFSKTAFIAMSTWFTVMLKYVFSGISLGATTTQQIIAGKAIPALNWQWAVTFDPSGAVALLTLVFGLYFGNKFSPTNGAVQENPSITK